MHAFDPEKSDTEKQTLKNQGKNLINVQNTYFESSVWSLVQWGIHMLSVPTNNHVEGWYW